MKPKHPTCARVMDGSVLVRRPIVPVARVLTILLGLGLVACAGLSKSVEGDAAQDTGLGDTWDVAVDTVPADTGVEATDDGCPDGTTDCGGLCVDLGSDPENCGSCDNVCPEPYEHSVALCVESECDWECEEGWVDLDEEPGCEEACIYATEACNGVDDNCNGEIDEVYPCRLSSVVDCETTCGSIGTGVCTISCELPSPEACTPPEETCNGFDDDCDGEIDEDWPPGTCGECVPDCTGRECGPDPICFESCGTCTSPETCNSEGVCICTPDCTGRECGPDPVCGQSCGFCTSPETCNASGVCECVPDCTGRECGPDPVCGVSCGTCTSPYTCNSMGLCSCTPDCSGRECGPDPVCGVSCGTCPAPETCNTSGICQCIPNCSGRECGPDPLCGVSCGTCSHPETCNSTGICGCVPDCTGRECGPDPVCGTSCGTCTSPETCNTSGICQCIPSCSGRECGPDPLCGTSCGTCTWPEACNSVGLCICTPNCTGRECGPDPLCGVSCGTCTAPESCDSSGICLCVPDCTGRECGADPVCGVSCGTCSGSETCESGVCVSPCVTVEDFEAGTWPVSPWNVVDAGGATVSSSASHDGTYGLTAVSAHWHYRTDVTMGPGDVLSVWVRQNSGSEGRFYLGFDATSSGCKSFIFGPNTDELLFQTNGSYSTYTIENSYSQSFSTGSWYRLEVSFSGSTATGRLYGSDGISLISEVNGYYSSIGTHGIAMRSFNYVDADTITLCN